MELSEEEEMILKHEYAMTITPEKGLDQVLQCTYLIAWSSIAINIKRWKCIVNITARWLI